MIILLAALFTGMNMSRFCSKSLGL